MQSLTIILLSFFLLAIQSSISMLLPWDNVLPNLSFPIVLHIGLHGYKTGKGAILAFAIGYLTDVFAGSPMGLHTLVTVAIFLVSRVAALRLFLQGWIFEIFLTFILSLISSILIIVLRGVFEKDLHDLLVHLEIVTCRAMATAVVAPIVFRMTSWLDKSAPRRRGSKKVLIA